MPLRGRAFLPIWGGLIDGYELEFDRWHTIEHMPERMGIPGFLRGRRYKHPAKSDRVNFQLYEAAHIETFRSPGYLARLNNPTEWSKRVQPGVARFIRGACQTLISLGEGVGGAIMTMRISGDVGDKAEAGLSLARMAPVIAKLHGVTAVHIGQHVPDVTTVETAETRLRRTISGADFTFVVLVEGIGIGELDLAAPEVLDLAERAGSGSSEADVYRLAYLLETNG
jgi:hypothetical protein